MRFNEYYSTNLPSDMMNCIVLSNHRLPLLFLLLHPCSIWNAVRVICSNGSGCSFVSPLTEDPFTKPLFSLFAAFAPFTESDMLFSLFSSVDRSRFILAGFLLKFGSTFLSRHMTKMQRSIVSKQSRFVDSRINSIRALAHSSRGNEVKKPILENDMLVLSSSSDWRLMRLSWW